MNMKLLTSGCLVVASALAFAGLPSVSNVTVTQDEGGGVVRVDYELADGPAIVTVDFQTNGISIGAQNFARISGDVNAKVDKVNGSIRWKPYETWPVADATIKAVTAVVTAWPTDDPPTYMVIDLTLKNTVSWYPCAEAVPFGVTDERYKTDLLVLRRIPAAGVKYRMGARSGESTQGSREMAHQVSFTKDFYLGVYPVTQKQWTLVYGGTTGSFTEYSDSPIRPVNMMDYQYEVRGESCTWPDDRHIVSPKTRFIGKLSAHAGIDFDIPTEAQWEYACRAGVGAAYNDGSEVTAANAGNDAAMRELGWFAENSAVDGVQQTHPVGLKKPNKWGLYDMHGNVCEWCLDWFNWNALTNAVDPVGVLSTEASNSQHVLRGGSYSQSSDYCRSAFRYYSTAGGGGSNANVGFRVMAPADLKW